MSRSLSVTPTVLCFAFFVFLEIYACCLPLLWARSPHAPPPHACTHTHTPWLTFRYVNTREEYARPYHERNEDVSKKKDNAKKDKSAYLQNAFHCYDTDAVATTDVFAAAASNDAPTLMDTDSNSSGDGSDGSITDMDATLFKTPAKKNPNVRAQLAESCSRSSVNLLTRPTAP